VAAVNAANLNKKVLEEHAKVKASEENFEVNSNNSRGVASSGTGISEPLKAEFSLRLSIDKDPDSGDWVYRALDPITGDVIKQYPREELLSLKRSEQYQPGSVIKTTI
jgi:flagellar protein FlaG